MEPSPGNMRPSCPVTIALGIRKARNPRIHQPKAVGPAVWMTAALVMNRTMATKIATMSNELRTLGRMPPAIRSESSSPDAAGATAAIASPSGGRSEFREVVIALEGGVVGGECGRLAPFDSKVSRAAQRSERLHEQVVPLERIGGGRKRVGQAADASPAPRRGGQGGRVHVDRRARVELVADAVQPGVDIGAQRQVGVAG